MCGGFNICSLSFCLPVYIFYYFTCQLSGESIILIRLLHGELPFWVVAGGPRVAGDAYHKISHQVSVLQAVSHQGRGRVILLLSFIYIMILLTGFDLLFDRYMDLTFGIPDYTSFSILIFYSS